MVGVGVTDKNRRYFFPAEVQPAKAYLRAFPAVKEKQLAFAAEQYRCKMTVWQRHHPAAP
jgi:hypothetical protein